MKLCSRLHESTVFSKHVLSCRRYHYFKIVFSPAREHMLFKKSALVQVIIPVLKQHASNTTKLIHIMKLCSRLHESTTFVKIGVLVQARAIFENVALACMRAPVFQNMCSRLGENTIFNTTNTNTWSTTMNHPRERFSILHVHMFPVCICK